MKFRLKIDNEWVEPYIGSDNSISLNYTIDSLENPSQYCSEYSYSLKLPRCQDNNRLFNDMYRLDSYVEIPKLFPNQKYDFELYTENGDIISRGDCYVDTIDSNYYNMSLNGSLSYVFQRLINSGWDSKKADEDQSYHLMQDVVGELGLTVNCKTVGASFETNPTLIDYDLATALDADCNAYRLDVEKGYTDDMAKAVGIVGFAPTNQGLYKDFSSENWLVKENGHHSILQIGNYRSEDDNGIDVEVEEQQINEFRSYYQQPYISINKLFQLYRNECMTATGYQMELDERWFNGNNRLLRDVVYMLPQLNDTKSKGDTFVDGDEHSKFQAIAPASSFARSGSGSTARWRSNYMTIFRLNDSFDFEGEAGKIAKIDIGIPVSFSLTGASLDPNATFVFNSGWGTDGTGVGSQIVVADIVISQGFDTIYSDTYYIIPLSDAAYNGQFIENENEYIRSWKSAGYNVVIYRYRHQLASLDFGTADIPISIMVPEDGEYTCNVTIRFNSTMNTYGYISGNSVVYDFQPTGTINYNGAISYNYSQSESIRSNQPLSLERLTRNVNPFAILLKYTKMMNLIWVCDDYNKKIKVVAREKYFGDCMTVEQNAKNPYPPTDVSYIGFADISNLIDKSKGVVMHPISWEDKTVVMGYSDSDVDLMNEYNEKYGKTYGSKTIVTQNRKNNTVFSMFNNNEYDTIAPSCINSEFLVPFNDLLASLATIAPDKVETYPQISNANGGQQANQSGNFYFHNESGEWSGELQEGWRIDDSGAYILITDDMNREITNEEYCWHYSNVLEDEPEKYLKSYIRPRFNIATVDDGYNIQFAQPQERYHQFPYEDTMVYLYDVRWKDYIEEIYNIQNKSVECYAAINATLYRRLKINPFVRIDNCIYMVCSIEGWNERNVTTKCILRQIYDLSKIADFETVDESNRMLWDSNDNVLWDDLDHIEYE